MQYMENVGSVVAYVLPKLHHAQMLSTLHVTETHLR